jgi:hypothetical protein
MITSQLHDVITVMPLLAAQLQMRAWRSFLQQCGTVSASINRRQCSSNCSACSAICFLAILGGPASFWHRFGSHRKTQSVNRYRRDVCQLLFKPLCLRYLRPRIFCRYSHLLLMLNHSDSIGTIEYEAAILTVFSTHFLQYDLM